MDYLPFALGFLIGLISSTSSSSDSESGISSFLGLAFEF
jgi:hypothetical protein